MKFNQRRLTRYQRSGIKSVNGWLHPVDAQLIATIGDAQLTNEIAGSIGEIGVHHGKLFILLYLLLKEGERAFCVDVFDMQHFNTDGSGRGDEAVFRANVARHAEKFENIHVFRASSDEITSDDIGEIADEVRLFSIDGGHTSELTYNDLQCAAGSIGEYGVVIIDDCFNPRWPGVADGVQRFFASGNTCLMPFAIGINKVFFSRSGANLFYRDALRKYQEQYYLKEAEFLGSPVSIFFDSRRSKLRYRFSKTAWWQSIRATSTGRAIRRLIPRY